LHGTNGRILERVRCELEMSIEIDVLNGDESWPLAEPLLEAVWPPDVVEKLPWAGVVFAHADLRVLVQSETEGVVCHVGIYRREVRWNGRKVGAGGIGGVATRGDSRQRGYASLALDAAIQTLKDEGSSDFAMLFCEPHRAPFYVARGWKPFDGEIYAEQPEGRVRFQAIAPYVYDIRRAPRQGMIDLCGLPW
jgi:aminoglycoside 2'-N-acetyltransferase I